MRLIITPILIIALLAGCAGPMEPVIPDIHAMSGSRAPSNNHWLWGYWQFHIPADRSSIEVVPVREGNYHYCVTKFLEIFPCHDCLTVSAPDIQPDFTLKYDVTLRHPFPGAPKYTGFDVRGMVYFPPTTNIDTWLSWNQLQYMTAIYSPDDNTKQLYNESMPLIFSRAKDGGGQVLNADGYSCYLIPGLEYSSVWDIFNYAPGANGIEPTPVTTITPYRLFASEAERRMFFVGDEITVEYHIALPEGPFTFSYAVDASWWPPDNIPVTDPATDFPRLANSEDPWKIDFEQLVPICEDSIDKAIFKITVHHRGTDLDWWAWIYSWGMNNNDPDDPQFGHGYPIVVDDFTTENTIYLPQEWWNFYGGSLVQGKHEALIILEAHPEMEEKPNSELVWIYAPTFVELVAEEQ